MSLNLGISAIGQVTRDGKKLIVPRGAILPSYCVKCGTPVEGETVKKTFRWHSPWIALLVILGVFVYVIVALIVTRKMDLAIPICNVHRERRRKLLVIGLVLLAISVPAGTAMGRFLGGPNDVGWSLLASFVLLIAALIFLFPMRNLLRPTYIDEVGGRFDSAGEEFLSKIPSMHSEVVRL